MAETTEATTTSTSTSSWGKTIISFLTGVVITVGSIFGITSTQINDTKAKVESIKVEAAAALTAIKASDYTTAKEKLTNIVATSKEVVADTQTMVDQVKSKLSSAATTAASYTDTTTSAAPVTTTAATKTETKK